MARADFAYITVDTDFSVNNPAVTKNFTVDGTPLNGNSYLLALSNGVSLGSHQVSINGTQLPSGDLNETGGGFATQFDRIPGGTLQSGANTLTIERIGNDNFTVNAVVVHWREA